MYIQLVNWSLTLAISFALQFLNSFASNCVVSLSCNVQDPRLLVRPSSFESWLCCLLADQTGASYFASSLGVKSIHFRTTLGLFRTVSRKFKCLICLVFFLFPCSSFFLHLIDFISVMFQHL